MSNYDSYFIYFGEDVIAHANTINYAYKIYTTARPLADLLSKNLCIVRKCNGEIVEYYNPI